MLRESKAAKQRRTSIFITQIPFSHAMCRLTYAGPAQRAEGSHFSSGSKSADELILMKELDAVGDALKGLLG